MATASTGIMARMKSIKGTLPNTTARKTAMAAMLRHMIETMIT